MAESEEVEAVEAEIDPYGPGSGYKNVIPDDKRTWLHSVTRVWSYLNLGRIKGNERALIDMHLPVQLTRGEYIRPVIFAMDYRVRDYGLIEPIDELKQELSSVAKQLRNSTISKSDAATQALQAVKAFGDAHGEKFGKFGNSLDPLIKEVNDRKTAEAGYFGIKTPQKTAMLDMLRHYKKMAKSVSSEEQGFVSTYEKAIEKAVSSELTESEVANEIERQFGFVSTPGQPTPYLDFASLSRMGQEAKIRLQDEKYYSFFNISNPIGSVFKFIAGRRKRKNPLEVLRALERGLTEGYYNEHLRTAEIIVKDFDPNEPHNAENFQIKTETNYQKATLEEGAYKYDEEEVAELAGHIRDLYNIGCEHEALYALRYLLWQSGAGSANAVPKGLFERLEKSPPTTVKDKNDPHWRAFLERASAATTNLPHSPITNDQRDVLKRVAGMSYHPRQARKFPGARETSTPFRNEIYKIRTKGLLWFWAHPTGARMVPSDDPNNTTPKLDRFSDGFGNFLLRLPIRLLSMPFYPGWKATEWILKRPIVQKIIIWSAITGTSTGLIGTATGTKIPLISPVGSKINSISLATTEMAVTPLRVNTNLVGNAFSSLTGVEATQGLGNTVSDYSLGWAWKANDLFGGEPLFDQTDAPKTAPESSGGGGDKAGGGDETGGADKPVVEERPPLTPEEQKELEENGTKFLESLKGRYKDASGKGAADKAPAAEAEKEKSDPKTEELEKKGEEFLEQLKGRYNKKSAAIGKERSPISLDKDEAHLAFLQNQNNTHSGQVFDI